MPENWINLYVGRSAPVRHRSTIINMNSVYPTVEHQSTTKYRGLFGPSRKEILTTARERGPCTGYAAKPLSRSRSQPLLRLILIPMDCSRTRFSLSPPQRRVFQATRSYLRRTACGLLRLRRLRTSFHGTSAAPLSADGRRWTRSP